MANLCPETPVQQMRFDLALELFDDVRRLDAQLKESHRRIRGGRQGLRDLGHRDLWGGTDHRRHAHRLLGRHQPFRQPGHLRLLQRHGTHRVLLGRTDRASGIYPGQPQAQPCHSHGGRHPDPQPGTPGRDYFERKVAEGKTKKEALRSLKRQTCNAVYRQLIFDAQ